MAIIKESFPNASLKADYGKLMEIAFPFGAEDVVNAPNWERLFTRLDSVKEILGVEHCGLRYSGLEEVKHPRMFSYEVSKSLYLDFLQRLPKSRPFRVNAKF